MKFNILLFFLTLIFLSADILAQEKSILSEVNLGNEKIKTASASDSATSKSSPLSLSEIKGLTNILPQQNKVVSLMFDDKESANISRVFELLKNNKIYGVEEDSENNQDDLKDVQENAANSKNDKDKTKSYIHLGSIIYLNDKEWAVWVNEKKITPETNSRDKEIYLESVERDRVKISWTPSISKWRILFGENSEGSSPKVNDRNEVEMEFILKPNQSFVLKNNSIAEGRVEQETKAKDSLKKSSAKKGLSKADDKEAKETTADQKPSEPSNNSINDSIGTIKDKLKEIIPSSAF